MNQVIQALLDLGIPRENIQTTAYNVNPRYDYMEGEQVFRGYEVSNAITVKITAISRTGNVIDTAVQNGVNRVSNIQFSIENRQFHYEQALSSALENALSKAKTIADTMHLVLDPTPVKIVEKIVEAPITYKTMATTAESSPTPIEPGQIVINATVEVQFQY